MKKTNWRDRVVAMLVSFTLAITSFFAGITVSASEASDLLFADDFNGNESFWTPVSGTWNKAADDAALLFADDFESGNTNSWNVGNGIWQVVNEGGNSFLRQNYDEWDSLSLRGNAEWVDYSFEADVRPIQGPGGVMMFFRFGDNNNHYSIYMTTGFIDFAKKIDGVQSQVQIYYGPSLDQSAFTRIKVDVRGDQIKVYRNGALVLSATEDSLSSGKVGVGSWNTSAEFDNIAVTTNSPQFKYAQTDAAGGVAYAGSDWGDYELAASVTPSMLQQGGAVGLSLRYADNDNRYVMQASEDGNMRIQKVAAGVVTTLAEAPFAISEDQTYLMRGAAGGKNLHFYIGETYISAVDETFQSGKIALNMVGATASFDNVAVYRLVLPIVSNGNTSYYVSASTGDDSNDGLSEATPWKTLNKVKVSTFAPGDVIRLKSGDTWNEQLMLNGSVNGVGEDGNPITVTSYGSGNKPLITAGGNVISGFNLSNWTIHGLAAKLIATSTLSWDNISTGINLEYDTSQTYRNVVVDGNEVYSDSYDSNTRGIVVVAIVPGTANATVLDRLTISNNVVHDVGWYGIMTTAWDTVANSELRSSQYIYGHVKISGNDVYNTALQGIVLSDAYNSVMERNVVHDGGLYTGANSWGAGGLWAISTRDTIIRFNEVYNMSNAGFESDGAGLNIDWFTNNITMQYNYAHDNYGNGITTMSNNGSNIQFNKVKGNRGLSNNGPGQIALSDFTGRPDLGNGERNVKVAHNIIIVDKENTGAVSSKKFSTGSWDGNKIERNHIVLKPGTAFSDVFDVGPQTDFAVINANTIFSDSGAAFKARKNNVQYGNLQTWQTATGYDLDSVLLPLNPVMPGNVSAVSAQSENGSVSLSWNAPQNGAVAHYNIYRGTDPNFEPAYRSMVGEALGTSFSDQDDVQPDTLYYYKIEAEDTNGNVSATPAGVSVQTGSFVPEAPDSKSVIVQSPPDGATINTLQVATKPFISGIPNISKVELYIDGVKRDETDQAPYIFTIGDLSNGAHEIKYKVYDENDVATDSPAISFTKAVTVLRGLYASSTPAIDGNIAEWGASDFEMNLPDQVKSLQSGFAEAWTPQTLSAKGYARWDDDNLYFAIKVTEAAHNLDIENAVDLWKGSSIQLAIDPDRSGMPGVNGYTELAFGLTNSDNVLAYRYHAIAGKAAGEFTAGEFAVQRDELSGTTTYEAAIPWDEIVPGGVATAELAVLGISALVNYSDGNYRNAGSGDARNGWIEYNSGIGSVKDPAQYGYFTLGLHPFLSPTVTGKSGDGKVKLGWQAVSGADGYVIRYGTASGSYTNTVVVGDVTTYEVTGLTNQTQYYFAVNAFDVFGESDPAEELILMPEAASGDSGGSGGGVKDIRSGANEKYAQVKLNDGTALVQIGENETSALIPLAIIAGHPLRVQAGQVTMHISASVLADLQAQAAKQEGANLEVIITPVNETEVGSVPDSGGSVRMRLAGKAYELALLLKTADGRIIKAEQVSGGIQLSLPYDADSADRELYGIYFFNEALKRWEYVSGGKADSGSGQLTVPLQHLSKYAVLSYSQSFTDVPEDHWAWRTVRILAAKHIVSGQTASTFNPSGETTRAQFVALLVRALNLPEVRTPSSFRDVDANAWFAKSVAAAVDAGIVTGAGQDYFAPSRPITRSEMAVMIVKALKLDVSANARIGFKDAEDVPAWALPYVAAASEANLLTGRGNNKFAPSAIATRAEAAQVIYTLIEHH